MFYLVFLTLLMFIAPFSSWAQCEGSKQLNKSQCDAISKLRDLNYAVIVKNFDINGEPKTIVVLGEVHFKPRAIALKEQELVDQFKLRLLEGDNGLGTKRNSLGNSLIYFGIDNEFEYRRDLIDSNQDLVGSQIHYSRNMGLYFATQSGDINFNGCLIGSEYKGRIYYNSFLNKMIEGKPKYEVGKFFSFFKRYNNLVQNVKETQIDTSKFYIREMPMGGEECSQSDADISQIKYVNIDIELGVQSQWKNYCDGLLCIYDRQFWYPYEFENILGTIVYLNGIESSEGPSEPNFMGKVKDMAMDISTKFFQDRDKLGVAGIREVFMGSNTFEIMKRSNDVGLVIVGVNHMGFFDHYFSIVGHSDRRSNWEVEGLKRYKK